MAPSTRCSDVDYAYVVYIVKLNNQDSFDRAFRVTIGGHMSPPPAVTGDTVGGMHCWIPDNGTHFDSGGMTKTVPYASTALPVNQYEVTVPKNGSTEVVRDPRPDRPARARRFRRLHRPAVQGRGWRNVRGVSVTATARALVVIALVAGGCGGGTKSGSGGASIAVATFQAGES